MNQNTDTVKIEPNDPNINMKIVTINGINRMSDMLANNDRDIRNQLMFLLTVFVGILTSYFVSMGYAVLTVSMGIFLLLITIFYIRNRKKQEIQFVKAYSVLMNNANKQKIPFPKMSK